MKAIIFDIDGTLSDNRHRLHLADRNNPEMWNEFLERSIDDPAFDDVAELCRKLSNDYHILFVTARSDKYELMTSNWLEKNDLPYVGDNLYMRCDGDDRSDEDVKRILAACITTMYDVVGVFEDKPECVDMWRRLGLTCFDVGSCNK